MTLEDRHGRHRVFPLRPAAFLVDGRPATLVVPPAGRGGRRSVSASGSVKVANLTARTARASRIWVEGIHDAALVETVWGHDLRVEGVVVEPMHGMDDLAAGGRRLRPGAAPAAGDPGRPPRGGQQGDPGGACGGGPDVLVTGHRYVDVWQAVKPSVGIRAWPRAAGTDWKTGVCAAWLG